MSQYASVLQLKEAVGITGSAFDTVDDSVLQSVLFRASAMVDSYLDAKRPGYVGFAAGSNSRSTVGSNSRIYHGNGTDTLFIDDAQSVSTVTVDGIAIASNAFSVEPLNEVPKRWITYVLPFSSVQGLLPSVWNRGTANVVVTAFYGMNSVPDDVQQVTIALAILMWQRMQNGLPPPTGPSDPEAMGILSGLDWGWEIAGVWGGGVSFGGSSGGSTW